MSARESKNRPRILIVAAGVDEAGCLREVVQGRCATAAWVALVFGAGMGCLLWEMWMPGRAF